MYVFVLPPLSSLCRGGRVWALSSACKTDQDDFTDWMSFQNSNLVEKISPSSKLILEITALSSLHDICKKYNESIVIIKSIVVVNPLIINLGI